MEKQEKLKEVKICQSCGMPITGSHSRFRARETDGSGSIYCVKCYKEGRFVHPDAGISDMVERGVPHLARRIGADAARVELKRLIPTLRRWQSGTDSDFDFINGLLRQDLVERNFVSDAPANDFPEAVNVLEEAKRVLILTGFCVLESMTGETDGLSGSLVLASALISLGKTVVIVTDIFSGDLLKAGKSLLASEVPVIVVSSGMEAVRLELDGLMEELKPDSVVSIERPGRAADGHSYSMRGEQLDPVVPQLDDFFLDCRKMGCRTIGIGDGGNELGMGSLSECIRGRSSLGCLIACATPADFSVAAAVSSWAGYGLAAALSLRSGRNLLPPLGTEEAIIGAIAAMGGMDGVTRKRDATVDGLSMGLYLQPLLAIYGLIGERLPDAGEQG